MDQLSLRYDKNLTSFYQHCLQCFWSTTSIIEELLAADCQVHELLRRNSPRLMKKLTMCFLWQKESQSRAATEQNNLESSLNMRTETALIWLPFICKNLLGHSDTIPIVTVPVVFCQFNHAYIDFYSFFFHVLSHFSTPAMTFAGPLPADVTANTGLLELETSKKWEHSRGSPMDPFHPSRKDSVEDEVEELAKINFLDLLSLNLPDWYLVLWGMICAILFGVAFPFIGIIFSDTLEVGVGQKLNICWQIVLCIALFSDKCLVQMCHQVYVWEFVVFR